MAPSVPVDLRRRARARGPCSGFAGALACAALGLGACDGPTVTVTGSGPIVREMRTFGPRGAAAGGRESAPNDIRLLGELDLAVHVGREFAVWIEGHAELVGLVAVALDGQRLSLTLPANTRLVPAPLVEIELPALAALVVEGAGTARVVGVDGDRLSLSLLGSGDLAVTGAVRHVSLDLIGSGEAHLEGLRADEVTIDKVGSGVARVAAIAVLRGKILGSGDLFYEGRPGTVAVESIGSGSVRAVGPSGRTPGD